jgi:26S proteasome regulatory subunit N2
VQIDARLEAVVNRMFGRCWRDGSFKQALGVALEARRLDVVGATLTRAVAAAGGAEGGSEPAATAAGAGAQRRTGFVPSPGADFLAYLVDLLTASGPAVAPASSSGSGGAFVGGISPLPKEWRVTVLRAVAPLFHRPAGMEALSGEAGGAASAAGGEAAFPASPLVSDYATYARVLQALDDAPALGRLLVALLHEGCDPHEAAHAAAAASSASSASASSEGGSSSSGPTPAALALCSPAVLLAYQVGLDAVESDNQTFLLQLYINISAGAGSAATAEGGAASLFASAVQRLQHIVDGSLSTAVFSDFLSHACAADALVLRNTKAALDPRHSVLHNALVTSHAYMYCGTSIDEFLRGNLDWLAKASNWNKFTACGSQGVVHKGRLGDSFTLLESYLPREGEATSDAYAEGGALYALGLIHANRGAAAAAGVVANPAEFLSGGNVNTGAGAAAAAAGAGAGAGASDASAPRVTQYLHGQLKGTMHEVLQHGACLGLGCAAMGTGDEAIFSSMRDVLFSEKAVASEGAALGIGLLLTGRGPAWTCEIVADEAGSAATEMLAQAHDTGHEKTIRGIGLALALMCYGQEEGADVLIAQLARDKDAVLRYGGMFAIALAYAGSGSNAAVRQLLHVAVSDVSDDVRRAAVLALGFVLCRAGREVPQLVAQLAESYNAHVRYGAALAVGIACAGSGMPDAVALLEPLVSDSVDFVRQGALLGLALVLQQESGAHLPKATEVRERLAKLAGDKHTSAMTKMGAVLGQGIIDAGGRNAITSLVSRSGFLKMSAVVGMALWLQHWYWYPTLHFLSLALTPTPLVGLNADFAVPAAYTVPCNAPASWFAYPPKLAEKADDSAAKVTTLELSTTAKAKAKAAAKKKEKEAGAGAGAAAAATSAVAPTTGAMDVDAAASGSAAARVPAAVAASDAAAPEAAKAGADTTAVAAAAAPEAPSHVLKNPCRVTLSQAKFCDFTPQPGQRYVPVRPVSGRGSCEFAAFGLNGARRRPYCCGCGACLHIPVPLSIARSRSVRFSSCVCPCPCSL